MAVEGTVLFTVRHIPISEIEVGARQRVDAGNVAELAEDIRKHGLLHPIVVSGNKLIAGFRRYNACKLLGWETIPAHDLGDLSDYKALEVELSENIRRKQLTWAEEALAYKRLLEVKQAEQGKAHRGPKKEGDPSTPVGVTTLAKMLNVSTATVSTNLLLAEALEENPELAAKKRKQVVRTLRRKQTTAVRTAVAQAAPTQDIALRFENMAAEDFLPTIADDSVHLWVTDPPWGVLTEEVWDDVAGFERLVPVLKHIHRTLLPGCHLYLCYGIAFHGQIVELLRSLGFGVDPVPIIWSTGLCSERGEVLSRWGHSYEAIYFAWKGATPRPLSCAQKNVIVVPGDGVKQHRAQKPYAVIKTLVEASSAPGELVGDCFAGSGVVLKVAVDTGRRAVGCELDPNYHRMANAWITGPSAVEGVIPCIAVPDVGDPFHQEIPCRLSPTGLTVWLDDRADSKTIPLRDLRNAEDPGYVLKGWPFDDLVGSGGVVIPLAIALAIADGKYVPQKGGEADDE